MSSVKRFLPWVVWFLATFFYIFQYVLRVSPSIMMQGILEKYHLHAYQFGAFSGAYYLGYAVMHIPIGLLLDRVGPKKVISLSILNYRRLLELRYFRTIFSGGWLIGRYFGSF